MSNPFSLFSVFGVELEYMIVDADGLNVRPVADVLLREAAGEPTGDLERGEIAWSNELALHVIEIKTNGPAKSLAALPEKFQENVNSINEILAKQGWRLMPTAMHPWMDPHQELKLWQGEYNAVYEAYHRIFNCRGHGWANLQSVHLNLPFGNDDEFGRLHAAIRLILPLLPALAASSPLVEGRLTGTADNRLAMYRGNADRVPSVAGRVVPEAVFTKRDYQEILLQGIYREIAPLDPEGILQHEWLNSRGAIARFDRNAIEIRLIDIQECPAADVAVCAAVKSVLALLVSEKFTATARQMSAATEPLANLLSDCIAMGDAAQIDDPQILAHYGLSGPVSAAEVWRHLLEAVPPGELAPHRENLNVILQEGTLSRRIAQALGNEATPSREMMTQVYRRLCDCLAQGEMFEK